MCGYVVVRAARRHNHIQHRLCPLSLAKGKQSYQRFLLQLGQYKITPHIEHAGPGNVIQVNVLVGKIAIGSYSVNKPSVLADYRDDHSLRRTYCVRTPNPGNLQALGSHILDDKIAEGVIADLADQTHP